MAKKLLEIPFYSQYIHVEDENWQSRACAPTCLKMVLDSLARVTLDISIDQLIKEGVEIGAYEEGVGWIHAGLCRLAHNHGALAYNEEFRSRDKDIENKLVEKGIEKIKRKIEEGLPVIISCSKNFDEFHKPHQVVLVGYKLGSFASKLEGFYYHEPEAKSAEDGANRFVSLEIFRLHWRKFAIFISK